MTYLLENNYMHNTFASLYEGVTNYFIKYVNPRFKSKGSYFISTYQKAIQKWVTDVRSIPKRPILMIDPTEYIVTDDEDDARVLWRYPVFGAFASRLFKPIYNDGHIKITPVFNRYKLQFTAHMWFESIYEMLDMQHQITQKFAGFDRYQKLFGVTFYMPIPNAIKSDININGINIPINWQQYNSDITESVYDITGESLLMYPQVFVAPLIKLISMADTGEKYGEDYLPHIRLSATFEMFPELVSMFNIDINQNITNIAFNMGFGYNNTSTGYILGSANNPCTINQLITQYNNTTNNSTTTGSNSTTIGNNATQSNSFNTINCNHTSVPVLVTQEYTLENPLILNISQFGLNNVSYVICNNEALPFTINNNGTITINYNLTQGMLLFLISKCQRS